MASPGRDNVVRRSVALSGTLVDEALAAVPEVGRNFNRLVATALQRLIEERREDEFKQAMGRMARDPAIRAECEAIARDFAPTEGDGLGGEL